MAGLPAVWKDLVFAFGFAFGSASPIANGQLPIAGFALGWLSGKEHETSFAGELCAARVLLPGRLLSISAKSGVFVSGKIRGIVNPPASPLVEVFTP